MMKRVLTIKNNLKDKYNRACQKMYGRYRSFVLDQTGGGAGDSPNWVFSVFVGVLLLIVVFVVFKDMLPGFIKDTIFGKVKNLE